MARGKDAVRIRRRMCESKNILRVVEDADPYDVMRRKISQRAAEGVGPYNSLAEFARSANHSNPFFRRHARRKNSLRRSVTRALASTKRGQSPARWNASIQKRGHIMASLLSFYLKSCASCRTISFTFMRRTFVEDSFSSSFMVM